MLKYALLGFLAYKPQTGYQIKQRMDRSTGHFWQAKQSQIYTTLKSLQSQGLVHTRRVEQEGRPDRLVYHLTEAGREDLGRWLEGPVEAAGQYKNPFLLKLFFSGSCSREHLSAMLRLELETRRRWAAGYLEEARRGIESTRREHPGLSRDARLWEATRRFGRMYEETYIKWLEETLAMVEEEL